MMTELELDSYGHNKFKNKREKWSPHILLYSVQQDDLVLWPFDKSFI